MKKIIMTGTLAALLTFGGLLVPALAGPVDVVVVTLVIVHCAQFVLVGKHVQLRHRHRRRPSRHWHLRWVGTIQTATPTAHTTAVDGTRASVGCIAVGRSHPRLPLKPVGRDHSVEVRSFFFGLQQFLWNVGVTYTQEILVSGSRAQAEYLMLLRQLNHVASSRFV